MNHDNGFADPIAAKRRVEERRLRAIEEVEVSGCIICSKATSSTAEITHDSGASLVSMCDDCQKVAKRFGVGDHPTPRWSDVLPRLGWSETTLCFAWGEAEGREITLQWGRLHVGFTIAWAQS